MPYRQNRLIFMLTEGRLVRAWEGEREGRGFRGSPRTSWQALDAPDNWPGLSVLSNKPQHFANTRRVRPSRLLQHGDHIGMGEAENLITLCAGS